MQKLGMISDVEILKDFFPEYFTAIIIYEIKKKTQLSRKIGRSQIIKN